MRKRGRPIEQLKRETAEGRVWTVTLKLRAKNDFGRTIREVAKLCSLSVGAVKKTPAWKEYLQEKRLRRSTQSVERTATTRGLRQGKGVEGRVFQIVKVAIYEGDFSRSVRKIADTIGCSPAAVGKTEAWSVYRRAREAEKEAIKSRRTGPRIR